MLPSVSYALPIWGRLTSNKDGFFTPESLHCRAAKLIYGLTRDMPTLQVLKIAKWDSFKLATSAYKTFYDSTLPSMGHTLTKKASPMHHLRTKNN